MSPLLIGGPCIDVCGVNKDFLDVRFGPDGTLYGTFTKDCTQTGCPPDAREQTTGLVARLVGAA